MMSTPFTIDYTSPGAPSNLVVTPVTVSPDPGTAAADLTWTGVSTSPENLERIEIWVNDQDEGWILAQWFTDPGVNFFRYHYPRSGVATTYRVLERVFSGSNVLTGLWAEEAATVTFPFISFVSVRFPNTRRAHTRYWPNQRESRGQSQDWHVPAGGRNYVEFAGSLRSTDLSLSAQYIDESGGSTAEAQKRALDALFDVTDPICVRDPRGHKWFTRFNGSLNWEYGKGGVRYSADFSMRKITHTEDLP
jgi:hypothetical protein